MARTISQAELDRRIGRGAVVKGLKTPPQEPKPEPKPEPPDPSLAMTKVVQEVANGSMMAASVLTETQRMIADAIEGLAKERNLDAKLIINRDKLGRLESVDVVRIRS